MQIYLSSEQQARLDHLAANIGTVPEQLATTVIARYLDDEALFLAAVEKGLSAAERGEFLEEQEMDARVEAMVRA